MKLNYKKTVILGFGFFAITLCSSLYDSYVPIFLHKFIDKAWLIGFLMTMDNYVGLVLQPLIGTLSDRTHTRFGRRMPYILICMPLAAVFICIIPNHLSLISLIIIIVVYNLIMSTFRSPTVALMPDITPAPLRSKANSVINFMGGAGAVIAFFVGSKLYKVNPAYPFYMAAVLLLVSVTILFVKIKEKRDALSIEDSGNEKAEASAKLNMTAARHLFLKDKNVKNVLFLLLAIFFWFIAYNSVASFFSLYGKEFLKVAPEVATSRLTYFSLSMLCTCFIISLLPASFFSSNVKKKKTIIVGLVIMIAVFGCVFFTKDINVIGILFIPAGIAWGLININSYPFVVSMTDQKNIGTYTGLYYLFSSLAAIASPPLIGMLIDNLGYGILFKYSVCGFILALVCILLVKTPKEDAPTVARIPENSINK